MTLLVIDSFLASSLKSISWMAEGFSMFLAGSRGGDAPGRSA